MRIMRSTLRTAGRIVFSKRAIRQPPVGAGHAHGDPDEAHSGWERFAVRLRRDAVDPPEGRGEGPDARTADDVREVEARSFFGDELPALLRDRGHLALPGALELGPRPTALVVDGVAWTLLLDGGGIEVRPGDDGAKAVVVLDAEGFADL